MLITMIRRELLDNLMTFRFATAVFITLLLVVANTMVLIKDYERHLASYSTAVKTHQRELREKKTYSVGTLYVDRPPNPLRIFSVGLDKQLGNKIEVYYGSVPTLWDAEMHGAENSFMNIFSPIDIVFIFKVILSLMALLFAYDSLSGERERGTLRLVMAQPVRHGNILLAKYISAMLCLLVPLLMSLLFALILLTTSPSISLNPHDFLRIGGIFLTSVAYISVFYLLGMLISAATHRSGTTLILSIFMWGFLVFVYPSVILAAIQQAGDRQVHTTAAFNQIKQMWDEFDRERLQFLTTDPVPGEDMSFNIDMEGDNSYDFTQSVCNSLTLQCFYRAGVHFEDIAKTPQPYVPSAQNYFSFLGPRVINIAERTWIIRKPALENVFIQPAKIKKDLLKLSPLGMYDAATQTWAGTDYLGIQDFFEAVRKYRQAVIDYFYHHDVFMSRQWFSADQGAVDWSRLPQFSFQRSDIRINTKQVLTDVCLLLLTSGILFTLTFLIFLRSDV